MHTKVSSSCNSFPPHTKGTIQTTLEKQSIKKKKHQKKTTKACRQRLARSPGEGPGPCKSAEWLSHSPLPGRTHQGDVQRHVLHANKNQVPECDFCWFHCIRNLNHQKIWQHWVSNFVLFLMHQFYLPRNLCCVTNLKKCSSTLRPFPAALPSFSTGQPASFACPIPPQSFWGASPLTSTSSAWSFILVIHKLSLSHLKNHHLLEAFWTQKVTKSKNCCADISLTYINSIPNSWPLIIFDKNQTNLYIYI